MTAFSAALRTGSITGACAGSTSMAKPTWPSRSISPLTIPALTMSPPCGNRTARSASMIWVSVKAMLETPVTADDMR
jgi:hypothetical protein